jgi:hypothetical protein
MSLITEAPEDNLIFHQIIAPVTQEEISFMQEFEIDDGDGVIDSKEFIILAVVRIGGVSPELIRRIHERFHELDRKHAGKILYDDLIVGRRKPPVTPSPDEAPATAAATTADARQRAQSIAFPQHSSQRVKARNNSLFMTRAKSVFAASGTAGADEIAANIAKIHRLGLADSSANNSGKHGGESSRTSTDRVSTRSTAAESSPRPRTFWVHAVCRARE